MKSLIYPAVSVTIFLAIDAIVRAQTPPQTGDLHAGLSELHPVEGIEKLRSEEQADAP